MTKDEMISKYSSLVGDWCEEIKRLTAGKKIEIESLEDEAGNDLYAVDGSNVYFEGTESYPTHELGFWDAITIIGRLEEALK